MAKPQLALLLMLPFFVSMVQAAEGEGIYRRACASCHDSGAVGAPRLGNPSFWKKRIKQGRETLYRHAIEGFRYMPPRGGVASLSDEEVKAAVDFMIGQSNACPILFFC